MKIDNIPFHVTDWSQVVPEQHPGESGYATWQVAFAGDIRVRIVEYSPGYLADHWCSKGHVLFVWKVSCEQSWKMAELLISNRA